MLNIWPLAINDTSLKHFSNYDSKKFADYKKRKGIKIERLFPVLNRYITLHSLYNQYAKHVLYAMGKYDQDSYYDAALKLYNKHNLINLKKWLEDSHITPDDRRGYTYNQFIIAIKDAYGVNVKIHCEKIGKTYFLKKITFYFNMDLQKMICTEDENGCPETSKIIYRHSVTPEN